MCVCVYLCVWLLLCKYSAAEKITKKKKED